MFFIDKRQTNSSGENRKKVSKHAKSLTDELQKKIKIATAKTVNGQYHIYSDEPSDEKCRDSKERLFIYIFFIGFFGLLKQQT